MKTFKFKIRQIPTLYVVIDGVEFNFGKLSQLVEELEGTSRYFNEIGCMTDEEYNILEKRGIVTTSVQGGIYCINELKRSIFYQELMETHKVSQEPERNIFKIIHKHQGYTIKFPTKIGIYSYANYDCFNQVQTLIIFKQHKTLMARGEKQAESYAVPLDTMPTDGMWKKLKNIKIKEEKHVS